MGLVGRLAWQLRNGRAAGVRVETFVGAGRYQHNVIDIARGNLIPEDIVDAQKRLNELLWETMPVGSDKLVSVIRYRLPKKYTSVKERIPGYAS